MITDSLIKDAQRIVGQAKALGWVSDSRPSAAKALPESRINLPPAMPGCDGTAVASIIHAVAAAHGLTYSELVSKARPNRVAHPRQLAMSLICDLCGMSLSDVARLFGKRDHGTVSHACRAIKERCKYDQGFKAAYKRWLKYDYAAFALLQPPKK